jgi:DNA-binding response OmpR family regulator
MAKKILIVEDSPTVLMMMQAALSEAGYEVVLAHDGVEGLNKARTQNPDLIVLDCVLPKLDGYNVCRMVKMDGHYKHIPVFMFTARTEDAYKIMGEKTGADEYIPKSSSLNEIDLLIEKVNQYLNS